VRLLFLDSWLVSRATGSGSAVAIAGLASGLRGLGHMVDVLRPRRAHRSIAVTRLLYNLTLRRRLAGLRGQYDVVVGFDFDGFAVGGSIDAKYVVALKGVAADERRFETGLNRVWFALWAALEGRNARSADRVFVTSEYSRARAAASYGLDPNAILVVPEAMDDQMAGSEPAGNHDASSAPTILSVARQYRRKDTATLIRALPKILETYPAVQLRIVGGGPELPALRELTRRLGISGEVVFLDSVQSSEALRREYANAAIFCLPSRQEGFGIAFVEAMSHGLPIVAAECGAVPEVAPHGEASLLVAPGDETQLAEAILRLLADPALASRLGAAGMERAARYTWTAVARGFLDGLETPAPA
jgi:glycosyltransferase involved in cell wall biosynthesis